ncbi:MAG: prenyltransferase/squalene oxidase repeat-containing protein [Mariniblastus sp.]
MASAYRLVQNHIEEARLPAGHWEGELSASALSTATAISALSFYISDSEGDPSQFPVIARQIKQGIRWLVAEQNKDGGWGDTAQNYSNISTTMLVVAALHAAGRAEEFSEQIELAEKYIEGCGGIDGLRKRYGKDKTFAVPILANCAMAGIVSWKEVSALPFEAACVPQKFYHLMQLPVVSYAIPALVAIGQAKFIADPPWDPVRKTIRRLSINRSLKVLERMQPASGGYLEAVPLTSFVSMALITSGRAGHQVVKDGVRFLIDSYRDEPSVEGQPCGSWPIDTNLATWNTTLIINANSNHPSELKRTLSSNSERWKACIEWVLSCQNTEVHPFTGAAPGGWGWSDLSGAVPDADDTPGALIALKHVLDSGMLKDGDFNDSTKDKIHEAARLGIGWLVKLQNRDRGWPTFCRGWGKLPFDRSGTDITAHAIRSFLAWQNQIDDPKIVHSIESGFAYLAKHQRKDGSWLPLWFGNQDTHDDENPCYGTAKVLMAYRDADSFDTKEAQFGLRWLCENQNSDGGWGGGKSLQWPELAVDKLGNSSVEETALCTELLLDHDDPQSRAAAARGVDWLINAAELGCIDRPWPIGFYFAKLWYFEKMYPLIFASAALGRALATIDTDKQN